MLSKLREERVPEAVKTSTLSSDGNWKELLAAGKGGGKTEIDAECSTWEEADEEEVTVAPFDTGVHSTEKNVVPDDRGRKERE